MTAAPSRGVIGMMLIIGSLLFLVAAFMPVSRVYPAQGVEQKMAIIDADRTGWQVSQVLFALSAAVAWAGMGLLAYRFRAFGGSILPLAAVAAAGVGLALWLAYVYLRTIRPEDFVSGLVPGWPFVAYSFLTLLAIFVIGSGMSQPKFPRWLPIFNMGAAALMGLAFLIFKDLPPLLYYVVTLVDGIALLVLHPF